MVELLPQLGRFRGLASTWVSQTVADINDPVHVAGFDARQRCANELNTLCDRLIDEADRDQPWGFVATGSALRVADLRPGDMIAQSVAGPWRHPALFIVQCPHPLRPSRRLVVWRLPDGELVLDELDTNQQVGVLVSDRDEDHLITKGRVHAGLTSGTWQ